jgi:hypothetical protein
VLKKLFLIGDWTGMVQPKPMPAVQTGLPNQFLAGGDQSQPGTNWTGPSNRLAQALVGLCLSNQWSKTAVQEVLDHPCSTGQCQQCFTQLFTLVE